MSERLDERLGELLRQAPPERDAMFRLGVIERREHQRFQRRSLVLLAAAVALALILAISFNAGADVFAAAGIAILCAALVGACFLSVPGVRQVLRRLTDRGAASPKN